MQKDFLWTRAESREVPKPTFPLGLTSVFGTTPGDRSTTPTRSVNGRDLTLRSKLCTPTTVRTGCPTDTNSDLFLRTLSTVNLFVSTRPDYAPRLQYCTLTSSSEDFYLFSSDLDSLFSSSVILSETGLKTGLPPPHCRPSPLSVETPSGPLLSLFPVEGPSRVFTTSLPFEVFLLVS